MRTVHYRAEAREHHPEAGLPLVRANMSPQRYHDLMGILTSWRASVRALSTRRLAANIFLNRAVNFRWQRGSIHPFRLELVLPHSGKRQRRELSAEWRPDPERTIVALRRRRSEYRVGAV